MLVVLVLLATVALRVAVVAAAVYLLLPRGAQCRACRADMLRLRNRLLEACLPVLERRWCLGCGWNGVVRRGAAAITVPDPSPLPAPPSRPTWE